MSAKQNEHFKVLREEEWKLKTSIAKYKSLEKELGEKISKNDYKLSQLKEQIIILKTKSKEMNKRIADTKEIPCHLEERRKKILRTNKAAPNHLKLLYEMYVEKVLGHLHFDLHTLLHCSLEEPGNESTTKEAYKVYGLLLSACPLKYVVEKVTIDQNKWPVGPESEEIISVYVDKAVDLTHRMLTLLPPLLVTTHLKEYKEHCHDTNRLTWNEGAVGVKELIYYRPILVYGNQLHVAVKGLVGNSKREISEEATEMQPKAQSVAKLASGQLTHDPKASSEHDKCHTGGTDGSATAYCQSSV